MILSEVGVAQLMSVPVSLSGVGMESDILPRQSLPRGKIHEKAPSEARKGLMIDLGTCV